MSASHSEPAFCFPGQGSQAVGMLQRFSAEETARGAWEEAVCAPDCFHSLQYAAQQAPPQMLQALTERFVDASDAPDASLRGVS